MSIASNLQRIRAHIGSLSTNHINLVAVSKLKPVADIRSAYECDQRNFGENYVAELVEKCTQLPGDIKWHMIGHLQSNKVNKLISSCPNLFMIETVDSARLANKIELAMRNARPDGRIKVLVEVKTSIEESKDGADAEIVPEIIKTIRYSCPHLEFSGLMTIADPNEPETSFKKLVDLKRSLETEGIQVETLSMGMSGDFELAIASGSNEVRIGSSIFGSR